MHHNLCAQEKQQGDSWTEGRIAIQVAILIIMIMLLYFYYYIQLPHFGTLKY